jgi:NADH-quinone oxidoreductase subunit N
VSTILLAASSPSGTAGCAFNPFTAAYSGLCTAKGSIHEAVAYRAIMPLLILSAGALLLLLLSATLPKRTYRGLWAGLTALTAAAATVDGFVQWYNTTKPSLAVGGQVIYDHFSALFAIIIGSATVLGALVADHYLDREGLDGPESYVLMLTCSTGGVLMAESAGLITLFIGLEILSISLYVLSAFHRRRAESGEAGLKYFILGSFSSAVFLYGTALVYGATGSTQYIEIFQFLVQNTVLHDGVLLGGMALLIVGLGFKVAAVPFHFWTPDVYQGAPTPFTGYMAAVAKAAGFAGLLRVLMLALPFEQANWRPIVWVLAVASMVVGSVLALVQQDIKRILAYSSISQAGYVLIGVQAANQSGWQAASFYLLTYVFMVIGTFAILQVLQGRGEVRNDLGNLRGLSRRSPWLAAAMLVLLLGQAGIPLTSGFLGKFLVIGAVLARGQYELAVIAMLSAAIAAFFYLRMALLMYSPLSTSEAAGLASALLGGLAPSTSAGSGVGTPSAATVPAGEGAVATAPAPVVAPAAGPTLRAPSSARLRVPPMTAIAIGVSVAFTIFAGVSSPVLGFVHHMTLPWTL